MFLLPALVIVMAGYAVYAVFHRRAQPATGIVNAPEAVRVQRAPFWPTTIEGKVGIGAFALNFALMLVIGQLTWVPIWFLPVMVLATLVLTGFARFAKHDHSTSVLIAFAVNALATLAVLLVLAYLPTGPTGA